MFMCSTPLTAVHFFFFFNDTATTEIYTLSLHDALPISVREHARRHGRGQPLGADERIQSAHPARDDPRVRWRDRKSTRLNSSHGYISYAVFCLKKKKTTQQPLVSQIEAQPDTIVVRRRL